MMNELNELKQIADCYATFAADEKGLVRDLRKACPSSAGCPDVLEFLATLPAEKRQPNLFLAAVRHLFGVPDSEGQLIDIVRRNHEPIVN
jgi:hypothetical protein